ncbi:dihydroneopterin aldolase [Marichromatium bheemlicum]|uniref:7,8-dihydroneopterin aldolase n=1 Tax=Marichromatium bheemlicum TaxID=365339 RepID=A0ABX1IEU8_9GAMM|nr:dihydroneopterin aldolase [Marichromatium bheemlicum]NKN34680.1 dihydroneopterin aldolase [Marichromatium bheemlicum]
MDTVFIRGLRVDTVIGIHDWEKAQPRPLILDLELATDAARAAATDHIDDALDYDAVARRIRREVTDNRAELIETLAERCAAVLREEFGIPWVRLRINKPGAIGVGIDVGIEIERGSRQND